jgi:excisionase family DNA binding protein
MRERGELRLVRGTVPLEDLPDVLTVEEAAAVLRIGRGAAYDLARRWRATGGREGLPVVRFGRSLRVPRAALVRLLDVSDGRDSAAGS